MALGGLRTPDRLYMVIEGLGASQARLMSIQAQRQAQTHAPKLSGVSAKRIYPISGYGWFGLKWMDDRVWFQNSGVHPFVMRSLAGKTIPMWIDDPSGVERTKNPKAKTRTTASGKIQVLIFRKVSKIGDRKKVVRRSGGISQTIWVPKSYPGAPGRIAMREAGAPYTTEGRQPGAIARGNVGIRWYFPGLSPRNFLQNGLVTAATNFKMIPGPIHVGYDFYATKSMSSRMQQERVEQFPQSPMAKRLGK